MYQPVTKSRADVVYKTDYDFVPSLIMCFAPRVTLLRLFAFQKIKKSEKLILVDMDVRQCALQLANQRVVPHLHPLRHHHHHHAPSLCPCQSHAHSQDPPDSQDAWDLPAFQDAVDSLVPPDAMDQWDQWDLPDHPDALVSQLHPHLLVHPSVFITVWRSVLNHAALLHPLCIFLHPHPLPCRFVHQPVPLPAVNKKWKICKKMIYGLVLWAERCYFGFD